MAKERRILALTGAAALVAVALNLLISAIKAKKKKRDLPGSNVRVNLSASEIYKLTDHIIVKSRDIYDSVASVSLENVAYSNVIAPLAELEAYLFPLVQSCLFPKMVSASDEVRKASSYAEKRLDSHFLTCRQREDVYHVIKAFVERGEWLDPEARRYVQFLVKDFERSGVKLTMSKRKEMESLRSKIDQLSFLYIQNLNEDDSFLLFSEPELAGMPPEFIMSLEKNDSGMLKVYLKSYHVSPLLEHCKIGASRKLIAVAYGKICAKENLDILENLMNLRHKFALLLGYSSYADFATEPRMAKTSAKVFEFLEDLSISLTDLATRELNVLKDLKRKEEGESPFGMEDLLYYMKRAEEQQFDLDLGEVKQYFPVNLVLSGVFRIFQDLLGLRFEEIKDVEVWHETVRLFSVLDSNSSELLGYFYLDIVSREGKYAHTCVLALQDGCLSSNGSHQMALLLGQESCTNSCNWASNWLRGFVVHIGTNGEKFAMAKRVNILVGDVMICAYAYRYDVRIMIFLGDALIPIALLVSQCPKQIEGFPVLLRFSEVVSLLHEFSHVVHYICNRATFSRFSGLRAEADFIEIPGQLLEHWCYESISLKMMSGFHKDITKSITSEICKSLRKRRDMFSGLKLKQEILYCIVDQIIHSSENVDIVELLKHLHPKVMLGIPLLDGTSPASCYPRFVLGYEAISYSHMWSEAIAADIFASRFQDDLLNQHAGMQFRSKVLTPGGAREPLEILTHYLGREPSIQSFIEQKTKSIL